MSQRHNMESLPREERIILALQAMKKDATLGQQRAAAICDVSQTTIRQRRSGTMSRHGPEKAVSHGPHHSSHGRPPLSGSLL